MPVFLGFRSQENNFFQTEVLSDILSLDSSSTDLISFLPLHASQLKLQQNNLTCPYKSSSWSFYFFAMEDKGAQESWLISKDNLPRPQEPPLWWAGSQANEEGSQRGWAGSSQLSSNAADKGMEGRSGNSYPGVIWRHCLTLKGWS